MQTTAVRDHISKINLVFKPDMDVLKAMGKLVERKMDAAPVVDDQGNIVGLLTERDCLSAALRSGYFAESAGRVSDFMSKDVTLIEADESILHVAEKAESERLEQYPVVEENRLIGYLGHREILKALMTLRGTV